MFEIVLINLRNMSLYLLLILSIPLDHGVWWGLGWGRELTCGKQTQIHARGVWWGLGWGHVIG
ncbi:hypothetical protein Hanom_Chr08g00709711 [Helianthus anomalus]